MGSKTKGVLYSAELMGDRLNSIDEFSYWFGWIMCDIVEFAAKVETIGHYVLFKFPF